MQLVFGHDAAVADWVAARIPHVGFGSAFGPLAAIGVADDRGLVAGIVYHNQLSAYQVGEMSFAAESARWATRGTVRALLSVPFLQYGWRRLQCITPHTNTRAIRVLKGLGFKAEGTARELFAERLHGVALSMLRKDFDRLTERYS